MKTPEIIKQRIAIFKKTFRQELLENPNVIIVLSNVGTHEEQLAMPNANCFRITTDKVHIYKDDWQYNNKTHKYHQPKNIYNGNINRDKK